MKYVAIVGALVVLLTVSGIGGVLTVIAAAVCLMGYYPIKFSDWVVSKFKKGNK